VPKLTRLTDVSASGTLVKPLLHQFVMDPRADVPLNLLVARPMPRRPDGRFHASQHPLMGEHELYQWMTGGLAAGDDFDESAFNVRMAVMFGSLAHAVIEAFLGWTGRAVPLPAGECPSCGRPYRPLRARPGFRYCTEFGFAHPATRSSAHLDAILNFGDTRAAWSLAGDDVYGFDFKCLAPETPVSMADGSLVPAGKISAGDLILGWDEERQQLAPKRVTRAWENGIAPVVKVRTRGGRELTVTDEHPFLTRRGWVKAADLVPFRSERRHGRYRPAAHDSVRTAWGSEWWAGPEGDADQAFLLGLLVGDGGLTGEYVNLTNNDPGVTEFASSYAARFGCKIVRTGSRNSVTHYFSAGRGANKFNGGNHFRNLVRREGLAGKGAYEKQVPPSVWLGGPAAWAAFLSGYLDADGCVLSHPYALVKWSSVNRELLLECQTMLSYLGIRSSVDIQRGRYKGSEHVSWVLWVRDARSVARAQQVLGSRHSQKRQALADLSPAVRCDGKFTRDNLAWDPVVEVTRLIARPTIAIDVEGHNHVTGGLVTHNTIYPFGLKGVRDMDTAQFREKWPKYWAQGQECMRLSGLRRYIFLFMTMGSPWEFREFHLDFDPAFAVATEAKYLAVISHLERGVPILA
jgi:hypothetical protein